MIARTPNATKSQIADPTAAESEAVKNAKQNGHYLWHRVGDRGLARFLPKKLELGSESTEQGQSKALVLVPSGTKGRCQQRGQALPMRN